MIIKAYSIEQFLEAHPISRTTLYRAWQAQSGPKKIKVGRRVLIPVEAAEEWVSQLLQSGEPAALHSSK